MSRRRKPIRIAAPPIMPGPAFATAAKVLRQTESMFRQRMIQDRIPSDEWKMLEMNADGLDLAVREMVAFVTAYEQWLAVALPLCSLFGRGQMKKADIPMEPEDPSKGVVRAMAYVMESIFMQDENGGTVVPAGIYYSDGRVTPLTTQEEQDVQGEEEDHDHDGVGDSERPHPKGGSDDHPS